LHPGGAIILFAVSGYATWAVARTPLMVSRSDTL